MWLGPPSIIKKITLRAFAGKCPGLAASGPFASAAPARSSRVSMAVNATLPKLAPSEYSHSRHDRSIDVNKLIGVHQHQADVRQTPRLGIDIVRLQIGHEIGVDVQRFSECKLVAGVLLDCLSNHFLRVIG